MNDQESRKTKQGDKWNVISAAANKKEIELIRHGGRGNCIYIFLTKADLNRMIKAL